MNCKRCGNPLAPGSKFCLYCGEKNEPAAAAPGFTPAAPSLRMPNSFTNGAAPTPATSAPAAPAYAAPTRAATPTPAAPTYAAPTRAAAPTYAAPTRAAAPTPAAPTYAAPTPAAPTAAAPTYAAPNPAYAAPAYPGYAAPAPKKSNKKLFLIIVAAVACVAVIALVLILVLGGGTPGTPETPKAPKTPGQAAEQLANAMEKGDLDAACRAIGVDYRKYIETMVQDMYEELDEDIDELRDYFVATANGNEWRNRAKNINSVNDAVSVLYDYAKESFAEEAEDGDYEDYIEDLRDADIEELTGSDKRTVIKNLESRFEDSEDALLFKLDDIEEVYTCEINGINRYIVKTGQGCFIIGLLGVVS